MLGPGLLFGLRLVGIWQLFVRILDLAVSGTSESRLLVGMGSMQEAEIRNKELSTD